MPPEVWPPRAHPLGFGSGKLTGVGGEGGGVLRLNMVADVRIYCIFKICSFCNLIG